MINFNPILSCGCRAQWARDPTIPREDMVTIWKLLTGILSLMRTAHVGLLEDPTVGWLIWAILVDKNYIMPSWLFEIVSLHALSCLLCEMKLRKCEKFNPKKKASRTILWSWSTYQESIKYFLSRLCSKQLMAQIFSYVLLDLKMANYIQQTFLIHCYMNTSDPHGSICFARFHYIWYFYALRSYTPLSTMVDLKRDMQFVIYRINLSLTYF